MREQPITMSKKAVFVTGGVGFIGATPEARSLPDQHTPAYRRTRHIHARTQSYDAIFWLANPVEVEHRRLARGVTAVGYLWKHVLTTLTTSQAATPFWIC